MSSYKAIAFDFFQRMQPLCSLHWQSEPHPCISEPSDDGPIDAVRIEFLSDALVIAFSSHGMLSPKFLGFAAIQYFFHKGYISSIDPVKVLSEVARTIWVFPWAQSKTPVAPPPLPTEVYDELI